MEKRFIHTVFEETVKRFPANVAIEDGNRRLTYDELNRKANNTAHFLRSKDVGGGVVGIFLPAGIEYVVCLLGIAKAGLIFLPLDVNAPRKREESILNKSRPGLIVSNEEYMADLDSRLGEYVSAGGIGHYAIEGILNAGECSLSDVNPVLCSDPDDGNYIMFTSGSTGEPKGILGCHKGLSHFIHWEINEFGLDESARVSQLAATTFDVSLRDILTPLLAGGVLCIPSSDEKTNIRLLLNWLQDKRITLMHCVPSIFRLVSKEMEKCKSPETLLPDLRYVLLAGESLYNSDVLRFRELVDRRIELVNLYGPSETILAKAYNRVGELSGELGRIVPIGQPISNAAILIIKDNDLCGIGEIGELYIRTPFRAKGYYNDDELTASSFVQNPLSAQADDIVYRTGDLGRYQKDRSVEFLGRKDNQVKINGIRVEIEEIESCVLKKSEVEQAVIVSHKCGDNSIYLTCYYVCKGVTTIESNELRKFLRGWLSDNMIPHFFVKMDSFSLNQNGKIDRKSLPEPEGLLYINVAYDAPANSKEEQLAAIWSEVLGLKKIGVNNSFIDLGGDSLKAIRVASRIFQTFKEEVSFQSVFPDSTVRRLAGVVGVDIPDATENNSAIFGDIMPLEEIDDRNEVVIKRGNIAPSTPEELEMLEE